MKVALVEVHCAHAECLYTQIQMLQRQGHHVTLIVPPCLQEQIEPFYHKDVVFMPLHNTWKHMQKLRAFIKNNGFDVVVFNTAQGRIKKFFYSTKPLKCRVYGVIHNLKKLKTSLGQQFISRHLNGYFVLSKTLKTQAQKAYKHLSFEYFFPIEFPRFHSSVDKPANELWIAIPGNVEFRRRDYEGLFTQLAHNHLNKHIKLIFLGRSAHKKGNSKELKKKVKEVNLEEQIIYFETFVPNDLFHAYLQKSDYILPLLHPSHQSMIDYLQYKISGSFNLAYSYGIPLLMHKTFSHMVEFTQHTTLFYELPSLIQQINQLTRLKIKEPRSNNLFNEKEQSTRYQQFISSNKAVIS